MSEKHTALPVTVRHAKGKQTRTLFDGNGKPIATIKHVPNVKKGTQSRAKEFAEALNSHAALVKALEEARDHFKEIAHVAINWQQTFPHNESSVARWRKIRLHAQTRADAIDAALQHKETGE